MDRSAFLLNNMFQLSPEISMDLTKMKNKDYYQLLVNKEQIEPKANSKWERDLQIDQTSLKPFFTYLLTAHHACVAHRAATKFLQPCLSLASFSMVLQL